MNKSKVGSKKHKEALKEALKQNLLRRKQQKNLKLLTKQQTKA